MQFEVIKYKASSSSQGKRISFHQDDESLLVEWKCWQWWRFENAASLQNYFLTLPRRLMRRSTIKDTNTINVQTAATAHVGVCSKVYTIAVVSSFNCPLWFYLTWTPQKSLSLSLFLQSSISASTPLLPRLKRSIIIMYANSGVQSMAWVVYATPPCCLC